MEDGSQTQQESILSLMKRFRQGDSLAAGELVDELYPDLKRLAVAKMAREPQGHSWQATQLVHELYLELVRLKAFPAEDEADALNPEKEKATFLKLAGLMMQRRLIDHAKPKYRKMPKVAWQSQDGPAAAPDWEALLYVEDVLDRLAAVDPKFRTVVEGRVFLGLTLAELGERLNCSERTAAAYWSFARQWLASELDRGWEPQPS